MAFHFAFLSEQEIISCVAAATAALVPKNSLLEMKKRVNHAAFRFWGCFLPLVWSQTLTLKILRKLIFTDRWYPNWNAIFFVVIILRPKMDSVATKLESVASHSSETTGEVLDTDNSCWVTPHLWSKFNQSTENNDWIQIQLLLCQGKESFHLFHSEVCRILNPPLLFQALLPAKEGKPGKISMQTQHLPGTAQEGLVGWIVELLRLEKNF